MISVRLTPDAIDPQALVRSVSSAECGAISLFLGTVSDHNDGRSVAGIEYSAYEKMAELEIRRIVEEVLPRFDVSRIAIQHRVGTLELGDISVGIAVAHEHRTPALDAARYIIEELKKRVPIWKQELYADGTREWVDPTRQSAEVSP